MTEWGPDGERATAAAPIPRARGLRAHPELSVRLGAIIVALGLLLAVLEQHHANHDLIAVGLAAAALGRGIGLRRPVLAVHIAAAVGLLVVARVAADLGHESIELASIVLAGVVALWAPPPPNPGTAGERRQVWTLVNTTAQDCIAPFALRNDKSYVFSPDGMAAVAYRVRFGVAVASGDPVGAAESQPAAAESFIRMVEASGWRLGVLGTGEDWAQWWRGHGLRGVPIGRDVVIDVNRFDLTGRAFRNLRQAVSRSRNAGVTTEIYPADAVPSYVESELKAIVAASHRNPNRGFAMILDGLLEDSPHPGTLIAVAFDKDRRPVAFHRFSTADNGREISQDLPWRRQGAPNGVDERLAHDVVIWAKEHGGQRVSLSFAAFPELYESAPQTRLTRLAYWGSHRLDGFIRLESLYRYLRKFHALGKRRFVMLRLREIVPVAAAMLTFEFATRRRSAHRSNLWRPADGGRRR
ncbi:MAG TPA: phosphatidylglycerol lysyltransferase domain-containing protein [Mycobacteriales bacterium]|nr:phosphatidylglycerol lysyltransferase domain-containing protein [Mycobacteriales bacterium]